MKILASKMSSFLREHQHEKKKPRTERMNNWNKTSSINYNAFLETEVLPLYCGPQVGVMVTIPLFCSPILSLKVLWRQRLTDK